MKDWNKHTVTILLFNDKGEVLGVSRKDDHTKFGLIGGKVDETDSSLELAAIRETKEETGLDIYNLKEIFSRVSESSGRTGHTFIAEYSGRINTNESGVVKWITFEDLKNGPFGKYNDELEKHLISIKLI